jgi:F0F1-type ATP synthase epsilon subunit
VEGGVAQVKDDRLTILTDKALPVEELSADQARTEAAAAAARPNADPERTAAVERARVMQRLAAR